MGVDAGDFDNDGDEDLVITELTGQGSTLYVNDGTGVFEERSGPVGVRLASLPFTGFGAGWIDFDNDGWLDTLAPGSSRWELRVLGKRSAGARRPRRAGERTRRSRHVAKRHGSRSGATCPSTNTRGSRKARADETYLDRPEAPADELDPRRAATLLIARRTRRLVQQDLLYSPVVHVGDVQRVLRPA